MSAPSPRRRPVIAGTVRVPGDKSITHRALLLGAISAGPVTVDGWLDAADTRSTLAAVRALGVRVDERDGERLVVHGAGLRGLAARGQAIDVGNAGTLLRLICGLVAGQRGDGVVLDGDASIRRRPMGRVAAPLARMGVTLSADRAPLSVRGPASGVTAAITDDLPVASAQVKSAILLAGLYADAPTTTREPAASRDHTETMLADAGVRVDVADSGRTATVHPPSGAGGGRLRLPDLRVSGDPSSAAFLFAAAAALPGSRVTVRDLVTAPARTGFWRILTAMGATVTVDGGDVTVAAAPDGLRGVTVGGDLVPAAIDELPLVGLLGAIAHGETVVADAAELRVKESDRVARTVEALRALGATADERPDGFAVSGSAGAPLRGGALAVHGDHRLAMLGAVAGLLSDGAVTVDDPSAADVSFPGFAALLAHVTRG